jgi:hypothetical protein
MTIAEVIAFPPHESITAGTVLMIGARCAGHGEMTAPAGWILDSQVTQNDHTFFVWHRMANGAEPATYVFVHQGWRRVEFVRGVVRLNED